jgi:hypothetical protein
MKEDLKERKGAGILSNQLTATTGSDGQVVIEGDKNRVKLGHKSGPHTFKFKLDDNTSPPLNVRFSSLGALVGEICPTGPGDNTGQIKDVKIEDKKAEFTDTNEGDPVTFAYAWFFACDDPSQTPTFDPIVDNGGNRSFL